MAVDFRDFGDPFAVRTELTHNSGQKSEQMLVPVTRLVSLVFTTHVLYGLAFHVQKRHRARTPVIATPLPFTLKDQLKDIVVAEQDEGNCVGSQDAGNGVDPSLLIRDTEGNAAEDEDENMPGTSDGYFVTETYQIPEQGFDINSILGIFKAQDVSRLKLAETNVTLPAALMLLDNDKYASQSRARKVIRQRSICISRQGSNCFEELGKVIARVYPGDIVGFQRKLGANYYAREGVPYREPAFQVPVVYEDDHMSIVNKPSGVVVYRAEGSRGGGSINGGHGRESLLSLLPHVLTPSNITTVDENAALKRPQPVHRLDRPTSGLVVVAKTKQSARFLAEQFEYRQARKTYMAIVSGDPSAGNGQGEEWHMIDSSLEGKSSITEMRVVRQTRSLYGKDGKLSLVELKPKTGRYHQLRRHMAWVCGTPIVGDTTYGGDDKAALKLRKRGLFLCSNEIEMDHPWYNTGAGLEEWAAMGTSEVKIGNATLFRENNVETVKIKARVPLPRKFESFLYHENKRALKFMG